MAPAREDPDVSGPIYNAVFGNSVYFAAFTTANGFELWQKQQHTAKAEQKLAQDIYPGEYFGTALSSSPQWLAISVSTLFFDATDLLHGSELWEFPLS